MAGHIQDRWFKEVDIDGSKQRVRSERHGKGLRYRARYVGPDGTEKSKSFADRQKREADQWLSRIEADMSRGHYFDPKAARITFRDYAENWLDTLTTDLNTRTSLASRLKNHAIPLLGRRPMDSFQPMHLREWLSKLETTVPAASYRRIIFADVTAIFSAAVDDHLIPKNPCSARSVRPPNASTKRVQPWTTERVFGVKQEIEDRFKATVDIGAGCGLRQGEIFGLTTESIDFAAGWLHVSNQVKIINGRMVFAPPKRQKERDVPLPERVAAILSAHMKKFPPVAVTLPFERPDGELVTRELVFTRERRTAIRGTDFNVYHWKPALVGAGVLPPRLEGHRHQAAREHGMHALRHFYASVLLDAGENIKALSQYLGHSDPGFTLRVYTHLMPSSEGRTRAALDLVYDRNHPIDGPETAQTQ